MKLKNRVYVFLTSYMCFAFIFFFTASLWALALPVLGLIYLGLGGLLHV